MSRLVQGAGEAAVLGRALSHLTLRAKCLPFHLCSCWICFVLFCFFKLLANKMLFNKNGQLQLLTSRKAKTPQVGSQPSVRVATSPSDHLAYVWPQGKFRGEKLQGTRPSLHRESP